MLKVLMCRCPFSVYHTGFLSILGLDFTPKTIYLSINLLLTSPMSSSQDTESTQEHLIHPFEMFRALMDKYEYMLFESEIIHPSIQSTQSYTQLFNNSALPNLPIVFAPGHQSIANIQCFLVNTDYNQPLHNLRFPLVDPVTKMSSHIPLDRMLAVKGYFSTKQPNCFVWEEGYVEKGSQVIFGTSGRLGRILGVCGVGRNFFMLRVKELGGSLDGEVAVQRMVVSFPPSGDFQLSLFQRLAMRFLKPFLGSMADFVDLEGVKADMESATAYFGEESGSTDEVAEEQSELGDSELTLSEEIQGVVDSEYSSESEDLE